MSEPPIARASAQLHAVGTAASAQSPESGLLLRGVRLALGARVLFQLDAHIAPGEVMTLMGPSGSGKSSLLAWLTGNLAPAFVAHGEVLLHGENVLALPPARRYLGMLFQDALLFPHLSVGQNLAFGLAPGGSRRVRRAVVAAALEAVDLAGFEPRDPATLSGGQRARVALMRTLLAEPRALLLDEPFAALEPALRQQMRELVFAHARQRALPVLLVTHDIDDARAAGGRVLSLDPHQGCTNLG